MSDSVNVTVGETVYEIRELGLDEGLSIFDSIKEGEPFNARLLRACVTLEGKPITEIPLRHAMKLLPVAMRMHGFIQDKPESEGNG